VRLRLEFTTEPFDLDEPPRHALVAREVMRRARLDEVEVGPFGNTALGGVEDVLTTVDAVLRRALEVGATRISVQVSAVRDAVEDAAEGEA
jgi:hypothetical protein